MIQIICDAVDTEEPKYCSFFYHAKCFTKRRSSILDLEHCLMYENADGSYSTVDKEFF